MSLGQEQAPAGSQDTPAPASPKGYAHEIPGSQDPGIGNQKIVG
jgi:hypothetical protein